MTATAPTGFPNTDLGNAERLAHRHGRDLRHCHVWGKWLVWDGRRWAVDDRGVIVRRAMDTVRAIDDEAWALRSEEARRLANMVNLARSCDGIPLTPDQLDTDPWALTVANGTLNLQTGQLRPHRRGDYSSKLAPVAYNPDATAPAWTAFLERILPDPAVRAFLQRAVGYTLTGRTDEQVMLLLYGTGANGKSTFVETIRALLGDYAEQTPVETLLRKPHAGGIPNDVAALRGARFVSAVESDEGAGLAEALVKRLTGGDTTTARFLRGEFFSFTPVLKLWLATNHRPQVRGTDDGIWRRIKMVPFTQAIPKPEQDPWLRDRLAAQLPGILTWAVTGCLQWQTDGLQPPPAVEAATASYRAEQDVLGAFLAEATRPLPGALTYARDLYAAYTRWCDDQGLRPLSHVALGRTLTERGIRRTQAGPHRLTAYRNITLPLPQPTPPL